jgi:RimJ/RimL family protein N-acetyltransferase
MLAGNMTLIAMSKKRNEPFGFVQAYNFSQDLGWVFLLVYYARESRTPATALEATYLFGVYLFNAFPLRKLYAEVFEYNVDVLRQLERVGWKEEGRFAKHIWFRDRYWSLIRMSLFREDWIPERERLKMLIDGQHGVDTYYEATRQPL